jgi:16S rRNA (cytidine1402-2'-O)-methyltransferase
MLYVISTPIGNLEDITLRALNALKECDYVLCEDTRRTKQLLLKHNIDTRLVSFNEATEKTKTKFVIEDLKHKTIGLVSDSGTPGISDPGFFLVRECIKNNIQAVPVPGASAVLSALVCSGMPTDRFTFYGFLPKSSAKRKQLFEETQSKKETSIFYESPYRIAKTLKEMSEIIPDVQVVVSRELTKKV